MTSTKQWQEYVKQYEAEVEQQQAVEPAPSTPLSETTVGQYLQLAAYAVGLVLAYVYAAGYYIGATVHSLSEALAKWAAAGKLPSKQAHTNAL
jgi:hypothetical protein